MTKQQIRTRILRALNDNPENPVFWSKAEIDDYIQDAQEVLAEESEALTRTFTIPRRAGVMVYHLEGVGEQLMVPYRIWLPGEQRRLAAWSITDLDGRQELWMRTTGDPWVWWPIDWHQFGIWPVPATAGGLMQISCYVWPGRLLDDDSQPEFSPVDHEALCFYGEEEGLLKQHDVSRSLDLATQFARRWGRAETQDSVKQMQGAFRTRGRAQGDEHE